MTKLFSVPIAVLLLDIICSNTVYSADSDQFHVIHINDWRAQYEEVPCANKTPKEKCTYGGLPRLTTAVESLIDQDSLVLNAGNAFYPTVEFNCLGLQTAVAALVDARVNITALGSWDFVEGIEPAANYVANLTAQYITPVLANVECYKTTNQTGYGQWEKLFCANIKKSETIKIKNFTVGIIGFTSQGKAYNAGDPGKLKITDEIAAVEAEAAELVKKDVNVIIALGSSSFKAAQEMAKNISSNLNIIIFGGEMILLTNQLDTPDKKAGSYPNITEGVNIVTAFGQGKYVGNFNFNVTKKALVGDVVIVNDTYIPDNSTQIEVNMWMNDVEKKTSVVIGNTQFPLSGGSITCSQEECGVGDILTDSVLQYVRSSDTESQKSWKDSVTMAVWQGGAMVFNQSTSIKAGNITVRDILTELPYKNYISILNIPGATLRKLFEVGIVNYTKKGTNFGFLQVSNGIQLTYVLSADNETITSLSEVLVPCSGMVCNGATPLVPLNDTATYRVATNSYLANGRGVFKFLNATGNEETGEDDDTAIENYLTNRSPLALALGMRIMINPPPSNATTTPAPTTQPTTTPPSPTTKAPARLCPNNTGMTVFLTLLVTAIIAGLAFVCYKYVYPRYRGRRGSAEALLQ